MSTFVDGQRMVYFWKNVTVSTFKPWCITAHLLDKRGIAKTVEGCDDIFLRCLKSPHHPSGHPKCRSNGSPGRGTGFFHCRTLSVHIANLCVANLCQRWRQHQITPVVPSGWKRFMSRWNRGFYVFSLLFAVLAIFARGAE